MFILFPLFDGGDSFDFAKLQKVLFFYQNLELISDYIHLKTKQETQHAFSFLSNLTRLGRISIDIHSKFEYPMNS